MNNHTSKFALRALVVALQSALLALGAAGSVYAQEAAAADEAPEVTAAQFTQRTNYVEVGGAYQSDNSFKFGEYNGLDRQGLFGLLNFLVQGGASFDSDDTTRWQVVGTNLGLDSRQLQAEYGQQGTFQLRFNYDELRHNISDSYQTPYAGAGTSLLTLPGNWLQPRVPQVNATGINFRGLSPAVSTGPALVNGVLVQPTADQLTLLRNIWANDTPAFQNVNLGTKRERLGAGFSYLLTPNWEIKINAQNEHKDGLRGQNSVTSLVREFAAVLPEPINQDTQLYNVGLNYRADKSFLQFAYFGSIYDNHVAAITWQDVNDLSKFSTMSSPPGNEMHQFNVTGGYHFSPQTHLVLNGSYGRGTQDETFLLDPQLPLGVPVTSADALVITRSFNAKLSSHPFNGFNYSVGYKFDDRDNQTPVNTYFFQDINEARASAASPFNAVLGLAPNTLGSNINIYANRPYSKKLNQFDLAGDYAVADGQMLRAAYQYQQIERGCDGSWINCADAPKTKENTGQFEWRNNAFETVSTSLSYTYSDRTVNYDENAFLALVPMANFVPAGGATVSVYDYLRATGLTGFGPYAAYPTVPLTGDAAIYSPNNSRVPQALYGSRNNANELLGLRRYNMADRTRDKVRAKFDWQASEAFALYGSVDFNQDDYSNSLYGLTGSESYVFNLEGDYAISTGASAKLYYTYDDRKTDSAGRAYGNNSNTAFVGVAANNVVSGGCFTTVQARNNNAQIDPCLDWTSNSRDKVHTLGFGLSYKGLFDGTLDIAGDLIASRARTNVDVSGGSYVNNPFAVANAAPVAVATYFIPAAGVPTVTTNTVELQINTRWQLNASSDVRLYYWFAHMRASDYIYDGLQFGSIGILMPTNEQAPSYNINGIGVSYSYHWN